jgi:hypothetical protein
MQWISYASFSALRFRWPNLTAHYCTPYNLRVQNVGLLEAWGLWWQGKSLQGTSLSGVPMLIVGRGGKITAFVGSIVAIIDIAA